MRERQIVGFHQDAELHWVAELECGHTQHVRHDPPWQVREWVTTSEGRAGRLGTTLDCVLCEPAIRLPTAAVAGLLFAAVAGAGAGTAVAQQPTMLAVDHVPIAVRQLRDAEREYASLGFRIKPGRPHANGLRNVFIKFGDGSSLELISPERGPVDAQSGAYTTFLAEQEGGAYLALRAPTLDSLPGSIRAAIPTGPVSRYGTAFATAVPADPALQWVFFIEFTTPPADSDEILIHQNGALGIETVWVSQRVRAGERMVRKHLPPGSVAVAPGTAVGPPIVGVTLRVRDAAQVQRLLASGPGLTLPLRTDGRGRSVRVPAVAARGIWIEFLERE
jgi:hypothetical protein